MGGVRMKRRGFLRQTGAVGAAASAGAIFPWLHAKAQEERTPRLVVFYTPHGTVRDHWLPVGSETAFTLPTILAPLARRRSDITVLDGLDLGMTPPVRNQRVPHTFDIVSMLTGSDINTTDTTFMREHFGGTYFGWNLSESVDQAIAARLPAGATPHRSIELGILCGNAHPKSRMSYSGPNAPRNPLDLPTTAYDQLFGASFTPPSDEDVRRQRSVLDAIHQDLGLVAGRLSAADRNRLTQHAEAIRRIEQSLGTEYTCTPPTAPPMGLSQHIVDQQSDILAATLACGMTQVVSMQLRQGDNDGGLYPWVGINSDGHHAITHNQSAPAQDLLVNLYSWYAERFLYLLDSLDAIDDGNGYSVLDNSFVMWVTELSRGWDHNIDNIPLVVAGGAAGRHQGGRFLTRSGQTNRLLVSAFHAMGLTQDTFGLADEGTGGVEGLISV